MRKLFMLGLWLLFLSSACHLDPSRICDDKDPADTTCPADQHFICAAGRCVCKAGYGLCATTKGSACCHVAGGQSCCEGQCIDTSNDTSNCGACGNTCDAALKAGACCGGQCVDTAVNAAHCGACGKACKAGQSCCEGRCIDLTSDDKHCGACGKACAAGTNCKEGACVCPNAGAVFCKEQARCVDVQKDRENCGACGNKCPAEQSCVAGVCSCTGADKPDYCAKAKRCVDLLSTQEHCGRCENKCPAGTQCKQGFCNCQGTDFVFCRDKGKTSGRCVDLQQDSNHCGRCDKVCPAGTQCKQGQCICPGTSLVYCQDKGKPDGACVDLQQNPLHCGACEQACEAGTQCKQGQCGCADSKLTFCQAPGQAKGLCVDLQASSSHCGSCNFSCKGGASCEKGVCIACRKDADCKAPTPVCDVPKGRCVNGFSAWTVRYPYPFGALYRAVAISQSVVLMVTSAGIIARSSLGGLKFTSVPYGKPVPLRGVDVDDSGLALVVGEKGNIFRSEDLGVTWQKVSAGVTALLYDVVIHKQEALIVGEKGTILRSTDGGKTWTKSTHVSKARLFSVARSQDTVLAVGEKGILLRSTDGGKSWSQSSPLNTDLLRVKIIGKTAMAISTFLKPGGKTITDNRGTLIRSTDGGVSWRKVSVGTDLPLAGLAFREKRALAVGYRLVTQSTLKAVILRSSDSGKTWRAHFFDQVGLQQAALGPKQLGVVAGRQGTLMRTVNGGGAWAQVSVDTRNDLKQIVFGSSQCPKGTAIAAGQHGLLTGKAVLLRSIQEGRTWSSLKVPSGANGILSLATGPQTKTFVAGANKGEVFRSTNCGQTWTELRDIGDGDIISVAVRGAAIWALERPENSSSNPSTKLWRYGLGRWVGTAYPLSLKGIAMSGSNGIMYGDRGTIYHTINSGGAWAKVTSGTNDILRNHAWVGSQILLVGPKGTLLRSIDNGKTWKKITISRLVNGSPKAFANTLQGVAFKGDVILTASASGVLLRSTDKGQTWQEVDVPLFNYYSLHITDSLRAVLVGTKGILTSQWE